MNRSVCDNPRCESWGCSKCEEGDDMEAEEGVLTFDTYNSCTDMRPCMKKPMTVHALKIQREFRVRSLEGDYAEGKIGDYLMKGVNGEMYICDKEIFEKSYDFTEQ